MVRSGFVAIQGRAIGFLTSLEQLERKVCIGIMLLSLLDRLAEGKRQLCGSVHHSSHCLYKKRKKRQSVLNRFKRDRIEECDFLLLLYRFYFSLSFLPS